MRKILIRKNFNSQLTGPYKISKLFVCSRTIKNFNVNENTSNVMLVQNTDDVFGCYYLYKLNDAKFRHSCWINAISLSDVFFYMFEKKSVNWIINSAVKRLNIFFFKYFLRSGKWNKETVKFKDILQMRLLEFLFM